METHKPQPLAERKSQNLNFWDFTKERLFWAVLPLVAGGAAVLFGKVTKFKIWPLDGSTDILSSLYAKGTKIFAKKHGMKAGEEVEQWINKGMWMGQLIDDFGGKEKEMLRKSMFNFVKGAEVAAPFSAYFLWNKKEGNRLDLEDAENKLSTLQAIKPSDQELALHNEAMRRELAFAAPSGSAPAAVIDKSGMEYHGRLEAAQKQRV